MPQEMDNGPAPERKKESIETCRKKESKTYVSAQRTKRRNAKQEKRERYKNKNTKNALCMIAQHSPAKKKKVGGQNPKRCQTMNMRPEPDNE